MLIAVKKILQDPTTITAVPRAGVYLGNFFYPLV